jgi:hypothetical protein
VTSRPPPTPEDICAEIAALLTRRIPRSDPERLHIQITALGLLPAHARRLLTYLNEHANALTSGDPAGPAALRKLLDLLASEHPRVYGECVAAVASTSGNCPTGRTRSV